MMRNFSSISVLLLFVVLFSSTSFIFFGVDAQSACGDGYYYNTTNPSCEYCPEGTFCNNQFTCDDACIDCTAGYYCTGTGLTDPTAICSTGYYCPEGSVVPTECPLPFTTEGPGATTITDCNVDPGAPTTTTTAAPSGSESTHNEYIGVGDLGAVYNIVYDHVTNSFIFASYTHHQIFMYSLDTMTAVAIAGMYDSAGNYTDVDGYDAQFYDPTNVALTYPLDYDKNTNNNSLGILAVDQLNHCIRSVQLTADDGGGPTSGSTYYTTSVAGKCWGNIPAARGTSDGIGDEASFFTPWGITADYDNNAFYISDKENCCVRMLTRYDGNDWHEALNTTTIIGSCGSCHEGTSSGDRFTSIGQITGLVKIQYVSVLLVNAFATSRVYRFTGIPPTHAGEAGTFSVIAHLSTMTALYNLYVVPVENALAVYKVFVTAQSNANDTVWEGNFTSTTIQDDSASVTFSKISCTNSFVKPYTTFVHNNGTIYQTFFEASCSVMRLTGSCGDNYTQSWALPPYYATTTTTTTTTATTTTIAATTTTASSGTITAVVVTDTVSTETTQAEAARLENVDNVSGNIFYPRGYSQSCGNSSYLSSVDSNCFTNFHSCYGNSRTNLVGDTCPSTVKDCVYSLTDCLIGVSNELRQSVNNGSISSMSCSWAEALFSSGIDALSSNANSVSRAMSDCKVFVRIFSKGYFNCSTAYNEDEQTSVCSSIASLMNERTKADVDPELNSVQLTQTSSTTFPRGVPQIVIKSINCRSRSTCKRPHSTGSCACPASASSSTPSTELSLFHPDYLYASKNNSCSRSASFFEICYGDSSSGNNALENVSFVVEDSSYSSSSRSNNRYANAEAAPASLGTCIRDDQTPRLFHVLSLTDATLSTLTSLQEESSDVVDITDNSSVGRILKVCAPPDTNAFIIGTTTSGCYEPRDNVTCQCSGATSVGISLIFLNETTNVASPGTLTICNFPLPKTVSAQTVATTTLTFVAGVSGASGAASQLQLAAVASLIDCDNDRSSGSAGDEVGGRVALIPFSITKEPYGRLLFVIVYLLCQVTFHFLCVMGVVVFRMKHDLISFIPHDIVEVVRAEQKQLEDEQDDKEEQEDENDDNNINDDDSESTNKKITTNASSSSPFTSTSRNVNMTNAVSSSSTTKKISIEPTTTPCVTPPPRDLDDDEDDEDEDAEYEEFEEEVEEEESESESEADDENNEQEQVEETKTESFVAYLLETGNFERKLRKVSKTEEEENAADNNMDDILQPEKDLVKKEDEEEGEENEEEEGEKENEEEGEKENKEEEQEEEQQQEQSLFEVYKLETEKYLANDQEKLKALPFSELFLLHFDSASTKFRFPGLSFIVLRFLMQGLVFESIYLAARYPGEVSAGVGAVGILLSVFIIVFVCHVAYRLIKEEQHIAYQVYLSENNPYANWNKIIKFLLAPDGFWKNRPFIQQYVSIFNPYSGEAKYLFVSVVLPFLQAFVAAIVVGVETPKENCDVVYAMMILLMWSVAIVNIVVRGVRIFIELLTNVLLPLFTGFMLISAARPEAFGGADVTKSLYLTVVYLAVCLMIFSIVIQTHEALFSRPIEVRALLEKQEEKENEEEFESESGSEQEEEQEEEEQITSANILPKKKHKKRKFITIRRKITKEQVEEQQQEITSSEAENILPEKTTTTHKARKVVKARAQTITSPTVEATTIPEKSKLRKIVTVQTKKLKAQRQELVQEGEEKTEEGVHEQQQEQRVMLPGGEEEEMKSPRFVVEKLPGPKSNRLHQTLQQIIRNFKVVDSDLFIELNEKVLTKYKILLPPSSENKTNIDNNAKLPSGVELKLPRREENMTVAQVCDIQQCSVFEFCAANDWKFREPKDEIWKYDQIVIITSDFLNPLSVTTDVISAIGAMKKLTSTSATSPVSPERISVASAAAAKRRKAAGGEGGDEEEEVMVFHDYHEDDYNTEVNLDDISIVDVGEEQFGVKQKEQKASSPLSAASLAAAATATPSSSQVFSPKQQTSTKKPTTTTTKHHHHKPKPKQKPPAKKPTTTANAADLFSAILDNF